MKRADAFTLVEMLAVVTIVLIVLGVTVGIFTSLSEQTGPESAVSTVQAAMHNARDYAATNGRETRLLFRCEDGQGNQLPSSSMTLQYRSAQTSGWEDIPGRRAVRLPRNLYVCDGSGLGQLPKAPSQTGEQQAQQWRQWEKNVLDQITGHVMSGSKIDTTKHDNFAIEFSPEGYPVDNDIPLLLVVRVAGRRVLGYAFYPMNPNAGTRLVFD